MPPNKKVAEESPSVESAEQTEKQKPIVCRSGRALVKIWTNEGTEGNTWRNATLSCLYKREGAEQWEEGYSFGATDVTSLISALESAQTNGLGGVSEEEAKTFKPAVMTPNAEHMPTTIQVGSSVAKIWNNGNEAGQKWKSLTTGCYYQDGSETKEGHSFGRREIAQLVVALKEAQKHMGTPGGAVEENREQVDETIQE